MNTNDWDDLFNILVLQKPSSSLNDDTQVTEVPASDLTSNDSLQPLEPIHEPIAVATAATNSAMTSIANELLMSPA